LRPSDHRRCTTAAASAAAPACSAAASAYGSHIKRTACRCLGFGNFLVGQCGGSVLGGTRMSPKCEKPSRPKGRGDPVLSTINCRRGRASRLASRRENGRARSALLDRAVRSPTPTPRFRPRQIPSTAPTRRDPCQPWPSLALSAGISRRSSASPFFFELNKASKPDHRDSNLQQMRKDNARRLREPFYSCTSKRRGFCGNVVLQQLLHDRLHLMGKVVLATREHTA
jgi:hypothetical protein